MLVARTMRNVPILDEFIVKLLPKPLNIEPRNAMTEVVMYIIHTCPFCRVGLKKSRGGRVEWERSSIRCRCTLHSNASF
jgi:hypothetical protein